MTFMPCRTASTTPSLQLVAYPIKSLSGSCRIGGGSDLSILLLFDPIFGWSGGENAFIAIRKLLKSNKTTILPRGKIDDEMLRRRRTIVNTIEIYLSVNTKVFLPIKVNKFEFTFLSVYFAGQGKNVGLWCHKLCGSAVARAPYFGSLSPCSTTMLQPHTEKLKPITTKQNIQSS